MLVKTNISVAGVSFDVPHGTEIDSEDFSALVGRGWEALCEPIEVADKPAATETADSKQTYRRGAKR